MIRQLTKTNVLMGGQLEWRIILGYDNGSLYVKDLFLGPVSRNIIYNNPTNDSAFNHPHRENIKTLYDSIKGDFFAIKPNPILKTKYPIHVKDISKSIDAVTMDQQYEMGAQRENIAPYGEQHSFLCPVWIDDKGDLSSGLKFVFEVKSANDKGGNSVGVRNALIINDEYNTKLYNYIKDYVEAINLNTDLINVDFTTRTATVCGVDCNSGDEVTKNIDNLVRNLTSRERPMLEQCNLIIRSFSDNHIICKQLFNFRFYFDISDITMESGLNNYLLNNELFINVYMVDRADENFSVIDSQPIPVYDMFSNFEFLPKKKMTITTNAAKKPVKFNITHSTYNGTYDKNCLNYMRDNECVDFLYENKLNQQSIYWRLYENNDQIFNLYKGLNMDIYDNEQDTTTETYLGNNDGLYDEMPGVSLQTPTLGYNTQNWANLKICNTKQSYTTFTNNTYKIEGEDYYKISRDTSIWMPEANNSYCELVLEKDSEFIWSSLLKYDTKKSNSYNQLFAFDGKAYNKIKLKMATVYQSYQTDTEVDLGIAYTVKPGSDTTDTIVYYITFTSSKIEQLGFKYIKDYLNSLENNPIMVVDKPDSGTDKYKAHVKGILTSLMNCLVYPDALKIETSLKTKQMDSPILTTSEFRYTRDDEKLVTLYRYGGLLYPMFINIDDENKYSNFQYKVKQYDNYYDLNNPDSEYKFTDLLNTKYEPVYPSINYYSLEKYIDIDYRERSLLLTEEVEGGSQPTTRTKRITPEYKWYMKSLIRQIPEVVEFNINETTYELITDELLLELFTKQFNPNIIGVSAVEFEEYLEFVNDNILKLYDKKVDYKVNDELLKTGNVLYDYTFTYKLK